MRTVQRISVAARSHRRASALHGAHHGAAYSAKGNNGASTRKLHFNGHPVRVVPAPFIGGVCFWSFEDVCKVLQLPLKGVIDSLDSKRDYTHLGLKSGSKLLCLTESGLLRLCVRRRTKGALQFHKWCMRYRIENSAFYREQGSADGNAFEFDVEKVIAEARKTFS